MTKKTTLNARFLEAAMERDGRACVYCGVSLEYTLTPSPRDDCFNVKGNPPQLDHDVPRSKGGRDVLENLVCACSRCNSQKGAKTGEEYRAWLKARKA